MIEAGARVLNVPDTTGYALPEEYGALFRDLREHVPGGDRVIWSAHCHNDLGMAVANSLAAVRNGARQVECTVNGIGERAGNTSHGRGRDGDQDARATCFGVDTGIVTEQIYPTSRLLSQITGIAVPINKPIVGDNAFAHEAGIHQDGVLKYRQTYEIMRPETRRPGVEPAGARQALRPPRASSSACRSSASTSTDVDMNKAFDALQGARRHEEERLRRGPDRARRRGVGARRAGSLRAAST